MGIEEDYKDFRKVFLKFKKNSYNETFSSGDIFYVIGSNNDSAVLTFIDQFFGDAFGLQCFFTKDGLNYVHDVLSTNDEYSVTVGDCDCLVSILKKKEALTKEDSKFLERLNQRKTPDNNLIIYRFKKGYHYQIASLKEVGIISNYGIFLDSLITNEQNDILEAFKRGDAVLTSLNHERLEYSVIYRPLPFLEKMPNKLKANMQFVKEYENSIYLNDECFLFATYLPVSIKGSGIRPLLCYFYFPNSNKMELKYIISTPNDYKNIIYGILDELFTKYGIPVKMIINNRDLYCILTKTLDALSIENNFERDNLKAGEDVSGVISSMYQQTLDAEMEEDEFVSMFNILTTALTSLDVSENLDAEDSLYVS